MVAHELAHARHDDVLTGSLLGAAGAVFGVGLLALVVGAVGGPAAACRCATRRWCRWCWR